MESYWLMSTELQFGEMKTVLEMNGGDGCATVCMYLIPMNYILSNS